MDSQEIKKNEGNTDITNNYQDYTAQYSETIDLNSGADVPESKTNSVISLIMGILSLVFCCCSIIGIIPGIIGIILASKAKKNGEPGGMATAGLVCSIIGIVFGVIVTIFYALYGFAVMQVINEWNRTGMLDQIQNMDSSELREFLENYQYYNY